MLGLRVPHCQICWVFGTRLNLRPVKWAEDANLGSAQPLKWPNGHGPSTGRSARMVAKATFFGNAGSRAPGALLQKRQVGLTKRSHKPCLKRPLARVVPDGPKPDHLSFGAAVFRVLYYALEPF